MTKLNTIDNPYGATVIWSIRGTSREELAALVHKLTGLAPRNISEVLPSSLLNKDSAYTAHRMNQMTIRQQRKTYSSSTYHRLASKFAVGIAFIAHQLTGRVQVRLDRKTSNLTEAGNRVVSSTFRLLPEFVFERDGDISPPDHPLFKGAVADRSRIGVLRAQISLLSRIAVTQFITRANHVTPTDTAEVLVRSLIYRMSGLRCPGYNPKFKRFGPALALMIPYGTPRDIVELCASGATIINQSGLSKSTMTNDPSVRPFCDTPSDEQDLRTRFAKRRLGNLALVLKTHAPNNDFRQFLRAHRANFQRGVDELKLYIEGPQPVLMTEEEMKAYRLLLSVSSMSDQENTSPYRSVL